MELSPPACARDQVPLDRAIDFAARLLRATRKSAASREAPGFVRKWAGWGAGPGAAQALLPASKARALLALCIEPPVWRRLGWR